MFATTFITPSNRADHQGLLEELFSLRHKVFVETLGWTLPMAKNGREIDQFDDEHATYLVVSDEKFTIRSALRLHDTSRPTLLTGVMSYLVDGALPQSRQIWEGTRLVVNPDAGNDGGRSLAELLYWTWVYASSQGCRKIVSVSDRLLERVLRRNEVAPRRLGKVMETEPGIHAVALEMDCNPAITDRLANITGRAPVWLPRAA